MKRLQSETMFPEIRRYFDLTDRESHGYSEAEIKAAEKRLGVKLPGVLRKYYRELGKHEMNHTQDFLVPPDKLEIDGGHLVFFTENQCVVTWSIRLDEIKQDDPPVYGCSGGDLWCKASPTTSLFLRTMLHHQAAIFHFSDFVLVGQIEPKVVRFVQKHFAATEENLVGWLPSFYGDSHDLVIQLWEADSGTTLMLAGKTRQQFLDLLEIFRPLKLQWNMMPEWMEPRKTQQDEMTSNDSDKRLLIEKLGLVLENGRWFSKKENTHPALVFTEHYVANHDVLAMLFRANKLCLGKLKYFRTNLDKFEPFKYHYEKGFVPTELWDAEFFRHKASGFFIDFRFLQSITVYEDFVAFCERLEKCEAR